MKNQSLESIKTMLRTRRYNDMHGYPSFAIMGDGECMCPDCVLANYPAIVAETLGGYAHSQWYAAGADINWENPDMYCCNCWIRIPSAYAEEEV